jgi:hypothetical protein
VFVSLEDKKSICVSVPHFSTFKLVVGDVVPKIEEQVTCPKDQKAPFEKAYDKDKRCHDRGGMPYWLPADFKRQRLPLGNIWEDAVVGLYGTTHADAESILKEGFKLPSERTKPNLIDTQKTRFDVPNYEDAIIMTPSHRYAMYPSSCGGKTLMQVEVKTEKHNTTREGPSNLIQKKTKLFINSGCVDKTGTVLFCLLQCRIKKEALTADPRPDRNDRKVFPGTLGDEFGDCRMSSEELEYRVADPKQIQPYGLLVRTMKVADIEDFVSNPNAL